MHTFQNNDVINKIISTNIHFHIPSICVAVTTNISEWVKWTLTTDQEPADQPYYQMWIQDLWKRGTFSAIESLPEGLVTYKLLLKVSTLLYEEPLDSMLNVIHDIGYSSSDTAWIND